jgi:hypothetical protein
MAFGVFKRCFAGNIIGIKNETGIADAAFDFLFHGSSFVILKVIIAPRQ